MGCCWRVTCRLDGRSSDLWNDSGNWTTSSIDTVPADDDIVVFPGTAANKTNVDNLGATTLTLQFSNAGGASTYSISALPGSSITLSTGTSISLDSGMTATLSLPLNVPATTFDIAPDALLIDNTTAVAGAGPITLMGGRFELGTSNFSNTDIKIDSGSLTGVGVVGNITNAVGAQGRSLPEWRAGRHEHDWGSVTGDG